MALIALLFLVVPLVELYVIVQVAQVTGIWETILLLLAVSVLGAWLVKRQGVAVWNRFNSTLANGQIPHVEIVDGVLILFAGALMLTPGFVTDALGVFLLVPPTRALVRGIAMQRFKVGRVVTFGANRFNGWRGPTSSDVWDAESWEQGPSTSPRGRGGPDEITS
jgi:UPF0716 protein FxsA